MGCLQSIMKGNKSPQYRSTGLVALELMEIKFVDDAGLFILFLRLTLPMS